MDRLARFLCGAGLVACIAGNVSAEPIPGAVVTTNPGVLTAGQRFDVSIAGSLRPNIGPLVPSITINGSSITVNLSRDCGFLCPGAVPTSQTVSLPALPAGHYLLNVYQSSAAQAVPGASPDLSVPLTVSPPNYTGLWWNSPAGSESGWAVMVEHQGDIVLALWFTYDASGRAAWYVMPRGEKTGDATYSGALYRTTGPSFDATPWQSSNVTSTVAGSASLTFTSPSDGTFGYTLDGKTQSKSITREQFASPGTSCLATD